MFNYNALVNYDKAMSEMSSAAGMLTDAKAHVLSAIGAGKDYEEVSDGVRKIQLEIRELRKKLAKLYYEKEEGQC